MACRAGSPDALYGERVAAIPGSGCLMGGRRRVSGHVARPVVSPPAPGRHTLGPVARDFSTISPSARWLLLAKAHSGLPYARDVAALVFGHDEVTAAATPTSPSAAIRRRHLELRARVVDEALELAGATRIVELAAGLSFRGLARAARDDVHYLDTDLPELVELKRRILRRLSPPKLAGTYRIEPLDVMDDAAFARARLVARRAALDRARRAADVPRRRRKGPPRGEHPRRAKVARRALDHRRCVHSPRADGPSRGAGREVPRRASRRGAEVRQLGRGGDILRA